MDLTGGGNPSDEIDRLFYGEKAMKQTVCFVAFFRRKAMK